MQISPIFFFNLFSCVCSWSVFYYSINQMYASTIIVYVERMYLPHVHPMHALNVAQHSNVFCRIAAAHSYAHANTCDCLNIRERSERFTI